MSFEWILPSIQVATPQVLSEVTKVFKQFGQDYNSTLITERMSGTPVKVRSGNLRRGWLTATVSDATSVEVKNWLAGPAGDKDGKHGYGWALEHGAVIKPINAKNLWIPILGNLTKTGMARIAPREAIQRGGFIRNNIFFAKKGFVGKDKGRVTPLFVLKKKVTLKPVLGAYNLWVRMTRALDAALTFTLANQAQQGLP